MANREYIHGYTEEEQQRLWEQAGILEKYVFMDFDLSGVRKMIEIGSGVGGETKILLERFPEMSVLGIEIEEEQIKTASKFMERAGHSPERYSFRNGDGSRIILDDEDRGDAALFIWVLEHLPNPLEMLLNIKNLLIKKGKIFAVEVFHDSMRLYPECPTVMSFWKKTVEYQESIQGDANIGFRLGNLYKDAGFENIKIEARPMHFGKDKPEERAAILAYFTELMRSAVPNMKTAGFTTDAEWEKVESEMLALQKNEDAVFYYSFIRGEANLA